MKVLIDTNIIVDAIDARVPFYKDAQDVLEICGREDVEGVLAAHSITNIFYILRKKYTIHRKREWT